MAVNLKNFTLSSLILALLVALLHILHSFLPVLLPSVKQESSSIQIYASEVHDDLKPLFKDAIASAKESITLMIYSLTDPQIITAIKEKSEQGVLVTILVDPSTSKAVFRKIPKASFVEKKGPGLMHLKILIIDKRDLFIGSANMTPPSLTLHSNLVLKVESPALAEALLSKIESQETLRKEAPVNTKKFKMGEQHIELWMLPSPWKGKERILSLLRSAKKTIQVAMFTWTRKDFAEELIAAAKRGVQVSAVIDYYSGKGASAHIVKLLSQHHIPVHLSYDSKLMHHKFALIDGSTLISGSANWTLAAFKENDDVFTVLTPLSMPQQKKMESIWQTLWKQSQKVSAS